MARTPSTRKFLIEQLEARWAMAADPVISEFMASNETNLLDGYGEASDWIEIHNRGDEPLQLQGWHLTDDRSEPSKWTFPARVLTPGEYLVVFASGDGQPDPKGNLHTSFKLEANGEYLALLDTQLAVRTEFTPQFSKQWPDISFGHLAENGLDRLGYFPEPTPGTANGMRFDRVTRSTVTASKRDGTFTAAFSVALNSSDAVLPIHYTLDGSEPTRTSPRYTVPVQISQTTTLKARVLEADAVPGPTASFRYVRLTASVASAKSQLPLLVIDNYGSGAIPNSNWNQTNAGIKQVPRQLAQMMIWEPTESTTSLLGPAATSQTIGIRVRGSYSSTFTEPGYSVETWSGKRESAVDVSLLGMEPASDWVLYAPNPAVDEALIDNTFCFELDRALGHWSPDYRYVELYLNRDGGDVTSSDYQGLYILIEKVERGPGRIEFNSFSEDAKQGGWLLAINRLDPISEDGQPPKNFHTAGPNGIPQTKRDLSNSSGVGDDIPIQYNAYINFEHPSPRKVNETQRSSIEKWFQRMEDILYGRIADTPWNDPVNGYSKYIEVDSFIDYLILSNLSKNGDALLLSLWIYNPDPNGNGKLTMGPMWDVDLGSFSGDPLTETMRNATQLWYGRLFRDPDFAQRYTDRWNDLRHGPLSNERLFQSVDKLESTIGIDAARRDGVTNWPQRLSTMKTWIAKRTDAIDKSLLLPPTLYPDLPTVLPGTKIIITAPAGEIYVTLNGSDPRLPGGAISPHAQRVTPENPIVIDRNTTVTARALRISRWSPATTFSYVVLGSTDLNKDGVSDPKDIDFLSAGIRLNDLTSDWNRDATIDGNDLKDFVRDGWKTNLGDSNLDGHFDSTDLIQVFMRGRYEATDASLAGWADGDWNGDGRFDSSDFIAAWSEGKYSSGPLALPSDEHVSDLYWNDFATLAELEPTRRRIRLL